MLQRITWKNLMIVWTGSGSCHTITTLPMEKLLDLYHQLKIRYCSKLVFVIFGSWVPCRSPGLLSKYNPPILFNDMSLSVSFIPPLLMMQVLSRVQHSFGCTKLVIVLLDTKLHSTQKILLLWHCFFQYNFTIKFIYFVVQYMYLQTINLSKQYIILVNNC